MDIYNDCGGADLERLRLAAERIRQLPSETEVPDPFRGFFAAAGSTLSAMLDVRERLRSGALRDCSLAELQALQREVYRDYLPEHYGESWLNPAYAVRMGETAGAEQTTESGETPDRLEPPDGLEPTDRRKEPENRENPEGRELGRLLSALYMELYSLPRLIFEGRDRDICPVLEVFLQVYGLFSMQEEPGALPTSAAVKDALYWYYSDYLDVTVPERNRELLIPSANAREDLFRGFPEEDLRSLFFHGDFISGETLKLAEFLQSLPEEEVQRAAGAFTGGFLQGFQAMNKSLEGKKTVLIRYQRGFERLVLAAAEQFREAGLSVILPGSPSRGAERVPGSSDFPPAVPLNRQADYDHRFDGALYFDKAFADRKLALLEQSYGELRAACREYAGPAVMETFGEASFTPVNCREAFALTDRQRKLFGGYLTRQAEIRNRFMPGDETSFTIIAWPLPDIGPFFPELFRDVLKVNTGDNAFYTRVQEALVDVLDRCDHVEVKGRNGNGTDLRIALKTLADPARETRFENCVADVNIPAGEVFTSPVLSGTEGVLHVSRVYIDGFLLKELRITFSEGRTREVSCANFPSVEENRRFVREVVMGSHDWLPMGEFAIGTGTEVLAMARKYGIEASLPILMAEKTGPHFALGDTCYSHEEDAVTFNPDGKAIVARDNEISARRAECPEEAYFSHHKDITLPYEELGSLTAVMPDGSRTDLLRDGRFVLPGTEELNRWL